MNVLAIVPARGGSKGVPKKNIKMLEGKPLINYTLDVVEAFKSDNFDIVVSTDSLDIASVAKEHGAAEVVMRDEKLSNDKAPMVPVVLHALKEMSKITGKVYDALILLQPTCPFRAKYDIEETMTALSTGTHDTVISFCQVSDSHPARMYTQTNGKMECLQKSNEFKNRQDLPPTYLRSGLIYASTVRYFCSNQSFYSDAMYPLIVDEWRSINIDERLDFYLAEAVIRNGLIEQ